MTGGISKLRARATAVMIGWRLVLITVEFLLSSARTVGNSMTSKMLLGASTIVLNEVSKTFCVRSELRGERDAVNDEARHGEETFKMMVVRGRKEDRSRG